MRLFLGINVPIAIKSELASFQKKLDSLIRGNLVPKENMHITMKFLGEVKDEQLSAIKQHCSEGISSPKFTAEIKGIGAFPSSDYVRVVWAGVGAGQNQLSSIRAELDRRLDPLGFEDEHKFHPHVTLARVKNISKQSFASTLTRGASQSVKHKSALQRLIGNNKETNFGKFRVERVSLMRSELSRKGASYSEVASYELR